MCLYIMTTIYHHQLIYLKIQKCEIKKSSFKFPNLLQRNIQFDAIDKNRQFHNLVLF